MEINNIFNSLLQENQASLFEVFALSSFDFFVLAKKYMKSKICRYIDGKYSSYHNATPKLIFSHLLKETPDIIKETKKNDINIEAARWLGYFYRRWHNITGEYSSKIVSQLTPNEGIKDYFTLHQMNEDYAIAICKRRYNLKRNAHRAYENKTNSFEVNKLDDEYYLSLVKNLFIKLYGTNEYKTLENNFFRDSRYDLISENKKVGIIFKALNKYSSDNIQNIFEKENEALMFSRFTAANSNLFILIKERENETFLDNEMNDFSRFYLTSRNKFDNIFVFNSNVLYQINKSYHLTKFFLGSALSKVVSKNKNL